MSRRWTIAATLALIAMNNTGRASAADWNLVLNGKAFHVDSSRNWNESNWGLGLEREFDDGGPWIKIAMGNGFVDSQYDMSYMAGGGILRRFRLPAVSNDAYVALGAVGFFMTRHDVHQNRPFPGVLPALTVGTRKLALNLTYIPGAATAIAANARRYDPTLDGILFLQIKLDAQLFMPRPRRSMRLVAADR